MADNAPRKAVTIYTDGACSGNPGPGGWGCVLKFGVHEKEMSGYMEKTTNNRMELLAAISGLGALKEACDVALYSDSQYLVKAFNENWLTNWQKRGWKTSTGAPVENRDLWEILLLQTKKHNVKFIWVKGHASNVYNNRCDQLATAAIAEHKRLYTEAD